MAIQRIVTGVVLSLLAAGYTAHGEDQVYPGATWQTKTPAELGLDGAKLDQFAANVGGVGCIVKDGYMVKTWGTQTSKADWASASKPVTSTMLFFAIEEGKLSGVHALIKDQGWALNAKDQPMTFHHLANMISGYARGEAPGAAWAYNDYAISLYKKTLFDRVYNEGSPDAAARKATRLGALQFQDGALYGSRNGYGISTTPRDFARIGWLWLNKGRWNGTQLLPKSYFDACMRPHVPANLPRTTAAGSDYLGVGTHGGGSDQTAIGPGIYGYNWWFNAPAAANGNLTWPDAPPDTFQANGHWNKEVMTVIPSLNMVVAARGTWGTFDPGNANASMNQNLKLLKEAVAPGPMYGQIIVDPATPAWLAYQRDLDGDGKKDPFFMCGPGDPEGFLYRGTRNADGTRNGDQLALIEKMKGTGANCIYFQAVRSHGGDGGATENPFEGSDPNNALDPDILNQWDLWFNEMDNAGIVIFLFFFDDGSGFAAAREDHMLRTLVNRFEHHKHLVWCIAEEYQEQFSAARVAQMAAIVRAEDDHRHPIAVHKLSGLTFSEFADDPNIDQFAIQYNQSTAAALHSGMVSAWQNAAGKYSLNMSEAAGHGTGDRTTIRKKNWACAMGGAYVMVLGMDIAGTPTEQLQDCGRVRSFFEATDFNRMAPHDELKHGGTEYVLALPGQSYIAYASNLAGDIGLKSMAAGTYAFRWFDCVSGLTVNQSGIDVAAGDRTWTKPGGIGVELAVWIRKTGGGGNVAPTANPQSLNVPHDTATQVTLTYSDPDGPGPYTFQIASGPSQGSLSGSGATRTYTPNSGYAGPDSFQFTVHDGLATGAPATVSLAVQPAGNQAPEANNQNLSTPKDTPVTVSLSYNDPDGGPGPYTVTITQQPAHGFLTGIGNDRTYTPDPGFVGVDSYKWKVYDGADDSNVATVTVTVVEPGNGLVAHWPLDEGSGTTAADVTGNGWTGTLNGPAWATGQLGGCLSFDGSNDAVAIAGSFDPAPQGTVAFWIKPNGVSTRQRILGGHDAWEVTIESTGKLHNQLFAAGSTTLGSNTSLSAGQWVHVACTYDFASKAMKIFLNGAEDAASATLADDDPGRFSLSLGTRTGAGNYYGGLLDDVRIYDRVLSPAEIAALAGGNEAPEILSMPTAQPNPVRLQP